MEQIKSAIRQGRFGAAIAACRDGLRSEKDAAARAGLLYMLAVAQRYHTDLEGALATAGELLALNGENGRGHQERGHILLAMERLEEAAAAYGQAVRYNPALKSSWQALAALHGRAGRVELVARANEEADYLAQLPPELAGALDLMHEGRLARAEQVARTYLKKHRKSIDGMRILAQIGLRLRIFDDAEFLLESAVTLAPDNCRARRDYAEVLLRTGKYALAREQAGALLAREPADPGAKVSLGGALVGLGETAAGIDLYREVLQAEPHRAGLWVQLGHAHKAAGERDAAVEAYRRAYALRPDYGDAYWSLANIKTYAFPDSELEEIRAREADSATGEDDRIHLCFAAGTALEGRKEYARAFEYYTRGNALHLARSGYDPAMTEAAVTAQIQHCDAALFEQRRDTGCPDPDPVFIVGLPRAGSTLLEQILASHSQVDGTMELHNILGLALRLRGRVAGGEPRYPRNLWELDEEYLRRFGEKYLHDTRAYRGSAPFFIDKMPNNFMHIGLIRLILPNAKVIDARRHPMACCFSAYKQLFGEGQDFTYGLDAVGRYYRDYVRLMDHWDRVLPGFVLRVEHEDVVADLEGQVRRLLDFCGLPFEQSCLEFHRTERAIRTPSAEQVRQPIQREAVAQWRHFESWLEPLKEALGEDILARYPL